MSPAAMPIVATLPKFIGASMLVKIIAFVLGTAFGYIFSWVLRIAVKK